MGALHTERYPYMKRSLNSAGQSLLSAKLSIDSGRDDDALRNLDRVRFELASLDNDLFELESLLLKRTYANGKAAEMAEPPAPVPAYVTVLHDFLTEAQERLQVMQETYVKPILPHVATTRVIPTFVEAFEEATRA